MLSSSGKMTKNHVKRWLINAFIPDVTNNTLLLLDSWSGQTDNDIFTDEEITRTLQNKRIRTAIIPPKTTRFVQPLDVYFFRQYKIVIRRMEDLFRNKILHMEATQKLHDRGFIMKMHSVVYHQFGAPILKDMLIYAWQKCGYITEKQMRTF